MEILVFTLSGQRLAVPSPTVEQVARAVQVTPLPGAPPVVEGLIDVRGEVLPVFDLRARFGLPATPLRAADHLVIARAGERRVALRVDRVEGLADVEPGRIAAAGELVRDPGRIAGVARLDDGLALIHDLGTFLARAEAAALDEALAAREAGTR